MLENPGVEEGFYVFHSIFYSSAGFLSLAWVLPAYENPAQGRKTHTYTG
jgi:hypothetical protein